MIVLRGWGFFLDYEGGETPPLQKKTITVHLMTNYGHRCFRLAMTLFFRDYPLNIKKIN